MRPELADPVRDQDKLNKLLPLAEQVYVLQEAGQPYAEQLKQISRLVGRIVDVPMVLYAFGSHNSECFARSLLTDWQNLPGDLDEQEMLELIDAICNAKGSEDRIEYWLKCVEASSGDSGLYSLIFWPSEYRNGEYEGQDLSPAEILRIALSHGGGHA